MNEEEKTPFDYLQSSVNGVTLREAYLLGKKGGKRELFELLDAWAKKFGGYGSLTFRRNLELYKSKLEE